MAMVRTGQRELSARALVLFAAWSALAGAAVVLIRRHGFFLAVVRSESMRPTLRPGDLLIVRHQRRGTPLRRGDLIVLSPRGQRYLLIKRVIGLPGERVEIDHRIIRIDGTPLSAPYGALSGAYRGVFDVPEDGCFVLGDNHEASVDSRSWDDPFVARQEVRGVVRAVLSRPRR
jgi:signal peptidase I